MISRFIHCALGVLSSVAILTSASTTLALEFNDATYLYGLDGKSGSLIRHSFAANSEEIIGVVTDLNGKKYMDIHGAAHIPGHTNIIAFWYDNANHTSKLLYINVFTGQAAPVGKDLGDMRITGATTQTIGGVSKIFAVFEGASGQELVYVDHKTGDTKTVMSFSQSYEGLAALPDGSFYGADDDNLYIIDPVAGTETFIKPLKHKHNDSLEWLQGELVGFSTAAGRLWRVDTNYAEMSIHPVDSSVRDIGSIMVIDLTEVPITACD